MRAGETRLRFLSDGKRQAFRSEATMSWRLASSKDPKIGAVLKSVEQHWIETGFVLDRDQLLTKVRALIAARR